MSEERYISFSSLLGNEGAFPYADLSTEDLQIIQYNSNQALKHRQKPRHARSRSPSPPPGRIYGRPRARTRARRLRSPSPLALTATALHRSTPPIPRAKTILSARPTWSFFSLFAPSLPLVIMMIAISIAVVALAFLLFPITRSFGKLVDSITSFDPGSAVSAVLGPTAAAFGALPLGSVYCDSIGIGCPEKDRQKAFRTSKFADHAAPQPHEQVSLGETFFDCLNDLRITRHHEFSVAHLTTLADKVMQFEHVLESPEELSEATFALARARRDLTLNANAARLAGGRSVGKVIDEYRNAQNLLGQDALVHEVEAEVRDGLDSVRESLKETAAFTLASSQHVVSADELAHSVARMAQKELSRLRRIANDLEVGLEYVLKGGRLAHILQPGLRGRKQDREAAGDFLRELVELVDQGAINLLSSTMSFQQCASNTRTFGEQVEKAFSLKHGRLSFEDRMQRIAPQIATLDSGLQALRPSELTDDSPPPEDQPPT